MIDNNKITTKTIGQINEELARDYLVREGLVFITNNFQNRRGEIDLIMQDNDVLVFIEVKYRHQNNFGGAISAIPVTKQKKIRQCAQFYLQQAQLNEYNTACRFDVIALQGNIPEQQNNQSKITWLKNAF